MTAKRQGLQMGTIKKRKRLSSFQIILLGFIGVIFLGALILMLPFSTRSGRVTPFNQALFTATSAVCVTGLVVQDTATYWSGFGQAVILSLIQIGGLGVITMAASFALLSGKKISLSQRSTMQNAISGLRGVWMAVFHSVSAFCNAGFDLMGRPGAKFASMSAYSADPVINTVLILLIVVGGIGFLTWEDVVTYKLRFKLYRLQSKVVLVTSAVLIVVPAVIFFFNDFAQLPVGERIFGSLFQSVTTRTAGFNTLDLGAMTHVGQALFIALMLIGGSPGSTAGGLKTTTVAVLFANAVSIFRRKEDPECFGRRIDAGVVKVAATIFLMYIALCVSSAAVISMLEKLPMRICLFETASAVGTVGLTLGVTPSLGVVSQVILMVLMFLGRVGGLTVIYAAISGSPKKLSKLPQEKITVG